MVKPLQLIHIIARLLTAAIALCALAGAQAKTSEVGEVTLTIGRAVVIPSTGDPVKAQRGSPIHSGDRVETAEGGHVHIRFVDGALVSVRPTSRLVIEDYQYDPAQPAQSTIRFRLDQGTTRAISGAAAQAAKERFRLNTPLVAIGVRGTDFVVSTQAGQTLATVNQGAIIMTPFGEGCSPLALGPCDSTASRYLSADMGKVFAEFSSHIAHTEIKPLPHLPMAGAPDSPKTLAHEGSKPASDELGITATGAVRQNTLQRVVDEGVVLMAQRTSQPTELPQKSPPPQLAWGRWGNAATSATDFSLPRLKAREGRQTTVGNNDYLLYRTDPTLGDLQPGLGNVSFSLQQAHAQLVTPTTILPATVTSGSLQIDFPSRQFSTALNVNSAPTGIVPLAATGYIRSDGLFVSRTTDQVIAGATALDGKTAGYLFEKTTPSGSLAGITLWGR